MVSEGEKAPGFQLIDQDGNIISLKDFKGKKVVLYFYPKDDTTGCTKEACSFRDEFPKFGKLDAVVLGVSADSAESHKKFIQKYRLPFSLLSDEKKDMLKEYGVWQKKSFMGKKYMGIVRTTLIIDENGIIVKIFPKVKVAGHEQEILNYLKEFMNKVEQE